MNRAFILPTLHQDDDKERQVSLARAAEEAAELTKEAMKALRFGIDNRYPEDGPTNAEKIVAEFHDLRQALEDADLIPPQAAHVDPAVRALVAAIVDEGAGPELHRRIMERHRREWPTLWLAIDRIVSTGRGR